MEEGPVLEVLVSAAANVDVALRSGEERLEARAHLLNELLREWLEGPVDLLIVDFVRATKTAYLHFDRVMDVAGRGVVFDDQTASFLEAPERLRQSCRKRPVHLHQHDRAIARQNVRVFLNLRLRHEACLVSRLGDEEVRAPEAGVGLAARGRLPHGADDGHFVAAFELQEEIAEALADVRENGHVVRA